MTYFGARSPSKNAARELHHCFKRNCKWRRTPDRLRLMMTQHAIFFGAERFDGTLRAELETIGPETDDLATQCFEGVSKKQELARGIDMAALPARCVPGVTDLDAVHRRHDIVIAARAGFCGLRASPVPAIS